MARRRPSASSGVNLRRRDRDLHRLFLKQRHAERALENLFQFVGRPMLG